MTEATQRRLAAIVSADVVGYSRLMGVDEAGTLAALRAHRAELIDPKIGQHGGRIVKTMGDGLLLEFPSVVQATQCVIEIQKGMAERNQGIDEDRRIIFRIGVHLGDVVVEGDDIFGDGINVAARLEAFGQPGGVTISATAHDNIAGRIDEVFTDAGEQELKNIARPVRIWQWSAEGTAPENAAADAEQPLALPDRPSIAVLPFDNMSGDPEQEYFTDGMTEDLITDLSKVSGLFVVARNSSFTYKGQAVDVRQAARQLGVRYILEGSVRKAGARVRINVQLIDALDGGHLWAERYDGNIDDVFELQDEVGAKVIEALAVHLTGEEEERLQQVPTHNLEAYELFVRAKATPYPPVPERIAAARAMFEEAIELDPNFAGGYAGVAWLLSFEAIFGNTETDNTIERITTLTRKAIELDDSLAMSHTTLAFAFQLEGKYEEAIAASNEAVARQPNDADAHAYRGFVLAFAGHPELSLEPINQAIRLSPQFISSPFRNIRSGIMLLAQDYQGAAQSFEENIERHGPIGPPGLSWAAATYWALDRHEDAARVVAQLKTQFPAFGTANWNYFKLIKSPDDRERIQGLMRAAGVPE